MRIDGRDYYLGAYGSTASRQEYARLIAERYRPGGQVQEKQPAGEYPDLSINELFVRYLDFATKYYAKGGVPTGEGENVKYAMRSVRALYEHERASEFGPLALKAVRQYMIDQQKLSRGVINSRINRIRRIFKWAVSEQLIPPSVLEGLRAVDGLRRGRGNVRETEPVGPVADHWVDATLPFLPPQVADMVRLARITMMRPGDVVIMRPCDIDRQGDVWIYRPAVHKTQYRGHQRSIPLGPKAQQIISPYLNRALNAYMFSPKEAEA